MGNRKSRYNFIILVVLMVMIGLLSKLGYMTLIKGDYYRKESTQKRIKKVHITAPRGDIVDRNGKLLAGSKPRYTIQGIKSDFERLPEDKQLSTLEKFSSIVGSEGVIYEDEFMIEMNTFTFEDRNDGINSEERVAEEIVNGGITPELLRLSHTEESNGITIKYSFGKRILNALEKKYMAIPVDVDENNNFYYLDGYKKWLKENGFNEVDPFYLVMELLKDSNEKQMVLRAIDSPMYRKIVYDYIVENGYIAGIGMNPFEYKGETLYREIKRKLSNSFHFVTPKSNAKDDFIGILLAKDGLNTLLTESFESNGKKITTLSVVEEMFETKDLEFPFKYSVDKHVNVEFKSKKRKNEFLKKYGLAKDTDEITSIITAMDKNKLIDKFITHKDVKNYSQQVVLRYVDPRISIVDWEYMPIADKNNWLKNQKINVKSTPEEAFMKIRKNKKIPVNVSNYEARKILLLLDSFNNLGFMGYYPFNIAYNVRNTTVVNIKENQDKLIGIEVSTEPIRYYPFETMAAHTIGYIGKINEEERKEKYTEEKGYSNNSLVGKTGVEDSYEEYLKGKDGHKIIEVDVMGNQTGFKKKEEAKKGNTLKLTLDSDLQKIAEDSLKTALDKIRVGGTFKSEFGDYRYTKAYGNASSGAAVAIDTETGEVLALANEGSFDLNLFSTGITEDDYNSLMPEDENDPLAPRPLMNVALQTAVQPGSTFKMVTGMAGVNNGISPNKRIYDYGHIEIGDDDHSFGCWIWNTGRGSHGSVDLAGAIANSCNYYFFSTAIGRVDGSGEVLSGTADIDSIMDVADQFGLNEKTGIEVPGEISAGRISKESKKANTKALLGMKLEDIIDDHSSKKIDEEKRETIIDEITSWIDLDTSLDRGEVTKRLEKLGLDKNTEDLTDIIKYSYLNQSSFGEADALNISIGQGENSYTTLQMANYMATLANGGTRHNVSVIDEVIDPVTKKIVIKGKRQDKQVVMKNMGGISAVAKGMHDNTTIGLAKDLFKGFPSDIEVAAKSGTAENKGESYNYDNYSWFVSYGPYEAGNPSASKIAVAVLLIQGGEGNNGGPVAREIMGQYFKLEKERSLKQ